MTQGSFPCISYLQRPPAHLRKSWTLDGKNTAKETGKMGYPWSPYTPLCNAICWNGGREKKETRKRTSHIWRMSSVMPSCSIPCGRGCGNANILGKLMPNILGKTDAQYPGLCVAPIHLDSAEKIACIFRVSRRTVYQWRDAGAPIVSVGGRVQAEYNALMQWLIIRG